MRQKIFFLLLSLSTIANATVRNLSFTKGFEDEANEYKVSKKVVKFDTYTEFSYSFEGAYVYDFAIRNNALQGVRMNGAAVIREVGDPELPIYIDMLIASHESNIELVDAEYVDYHGFEIRPATAIASKKNDKEGVDLTYSGVYEKDEYYPKNNVTLLRKHTYRSIPYVSLQVSPIQYNPITKSLRCCKSLTYRVYTDNRVMSYDSKDYKTLRNVLGNQTYEDKTTKNSSPMKIHAAPSDGNSVEKKTTCDYLIVTTDRFKTPVEKFVRWKTIQGHRCKILSKSSWTDCDEVLSQIKKVYNSDKPEYFLIVGDVEDVPSYHIPLNSTYYLSDLPYTILSETYQDTEEYYIYPDMYHGRISVSNEYEANVVVDKIINYERYPVEDEDFYSEATHIVGAGDIDDDGREADYFTLESELIRDYMMAWGKDVNRVYYRENEAVEYNEYSASFDNRMPDELKEMSMWNGNADMVRSEFNDGRLYVLYCSHGNTDGWGNIGFLTGNVSSLENGNMLPVVFSETCLSGAFGEECCFAEALLRKEDGGCVGITAATDTSLFLWTEVLDICMFNILHPYPGIRVKFGDSENAGWFADTRDMDNGEPEYEMGKLLRHGMVKMTQAIGTYNDYTCLEFHYLGDPSMEIYTETPACLDPSIVQNGSTVSVNTNGVDGCKIVLSSMSGDEIYVAENTGSASFSNVTFPYTVLVSKHNYKPYVKHSVSYLQDENIKYNREVLANDIIAGNNVTSLYGSGDVVVNGGKLSLVAKNSIQLQPGFKTNGGKLLVHKGTDYDCPFSFDDPVSVYNEAQRIAPHRHPDLPELTETNDLASASNALYVDGNALVFRFTDPTDVEVSDMLGRVVYVRSGLRQGSVDLSRGVYTVKYGDSLKKILITKE